MTLPDESPRWHVVRALRQSATTVPDAREKVARLARAVYTLRCDAGTAFRIEFRFTRPETRDAWTNQVVAFLRNTITLRL